MVAGLFEACSTVFSLAWCVRWPLLFVAEPAFPPYLVRKPQPASAICYLVHLSSGGGDGGEAAAHLLGQWKSDGGRTR